MEKKSKYSKYIELQKEMAGRVCLEPFVGEINYVGGVDVAFSNEGKEAIAGAVLLRYPTMEILEKASARGAVEIPYIPGLLSFREAPVMGEAVRGLSRRPDILLVDGQGVAHPRRFGLACHLGLDLDMATIGCAKSRLVGCFEEPGQEKGDYSGLYDGDEQIGVVLRSRRKVRCLYVSCGHRVSLEQAREVTLTCCVRYRIAEPTRQGHKYVSELRKDG